MIQKESGFYTLKGYQQQNTAALTTAMEDYLEMICRLSDKKEVHIRELSNALHVKPSSASKMVQNLKVAGYLFFPKYGSITLSEKGAQYGAYLLYRHQVLHRFLCLLNQTENELEQVEKIEHFLNEETITRLATLTEQLEAGNKGKTPEH